MPALYFLHGMESSPLGTKARLIKSIYPNCIIPELPPDIRRREEILTEMIQQPSMLVGSSLGGLSALMFAMQRPDLIQGMVLMAPAVGFSSALLPEEEMEIARNTFIPAGIPCSVFAGLQDELIPIESIKELIKRSPDPDLIEFFEVEDDHFLNKTLDPMLEQIEKTRILIAD